MTGPESRRWEPLQVGIQLLFLAPLAYQAAFPRLGPLTAADFHFFAGAGAFFLSPIAVLANAAAGWLLPPRRMWLWSLALLWLVVAATSWLYTRGAIGRQLHEASTVAEARKHCTITQAADYYDRGAEVYCQTPDGRVLRLWISNGPYPWSKWQAEVGR